MVSLEYFKTIEKRLEEKVDLAQKNVIELEESIKTLLAQTNNKDVLKSDSSDE